MPRMNGFELHTEMRKVDQQVNVCFITAGEMYYDEVGPEKEKKEKNNIVSYMENGFYKKPISNAAIVKRINKLMLLTRSPFIQNT